MAAIVEELKVACDKRDYAAADNLLRQLGILIEKAKALQRE